MLQKHRKIKSAAGSPPSLDLLFSLDDCQGSFAPDNFQPYMQGEQDAYGHHYFSECDVNGMPPGNFFLPEQQSYHGYNPYEVVTKPDPATMMPCGNVNLNTQFKNEASYPEIFPYPNLAVVPSDYDYYNDPTNIPDISNFFYSPSPVQYMMNSYVDDQGHAIMHHVPNQCDIMEGVPLGVGAEFSYHHPTTNHFQYPNIPPLTEESENVFCQTTPEPSVASYELKTIPRTPPPRSSNNTDLVLYDSVPESDIVSLLSQHADSALSSQTFKNFTPEPSPDVSAFSPHTPVTRTPEIQRAQGFCRNQAPTHFPNRRRKSTSCLRHPVAAICKTTERMQIFDSILEASLALSVPRSNIQSCLKKPGKIAKGYWFKELGDPNLARFRQHVLAKNPLQKYSGSKKRGQEYGKFERDVKPETASGRGSYDFDVEPGHDLINESSNGDPDDHGPLLMLTSADELLFVPLRYDFYTHESRRPSHKRSHRFIPTYTSSSSDGTSKICGDSDSTRSSESPDSDCKKRSATELQSIAPTPTSAQNESAPKKLKSDPNAAKMIPNGSMWSQLNYY